MKFVLLELNHNILNIVGFLQKRMQGNPYRVPLGCVILDFKIHFGNYAYLFYLVMIQIMFSYKIIPNHMEIMNCKEVE